MEFLAAFGIVLLFLGSLLYLLVCIDPNRPGFLGKIHRFVFNDFPEIMRKILGDRVINFFGGIIHYVFYTNHPLVQFFYLLVAVGGFIVYALFGFLKLFDNNPEVNFVHSLIGTFLALMSFHSYYQACYFGAGIIYKDNADQYNEEFKDSLDSILYMRENICTTCNIIKPARSKHCRVCDVCVSRFDHHCVWIRQCVGQKNYKYFLKFILLHATLTCYGSWLGVKALYGLVLKQNLLNASFRNPITKEIIKGSYLTIFKYMFFQETMFVFITLLCTIMGITLALFFLYHLSMVRVDNTTNEKMKISDFKAYFEQDIAKMKKQVETEIEEDKKKKISDKLHRFEVNLKKLNEKNVIGVWKGLKKIFSQPDEVKWKVLRQRKRAMRKNMKKEEEKEKVKNE